MGAPAISVLVSPRARRIAVIAGLALVVGLSLIPAVAAALVRRSPAWWAMVAPDDPEAEQQAEWLENAVFDQLFQERQVGEADDDRHWTSREWTVSLEAPLANAWLNTRLPKWLANQGVNWPSEISQIQVYFAEGWVAIGAEVDAGDGDRVVSATLVPEIGADGELNVPARWVHVGQLTMPAEWVLTRAERQAESLLPPEVRDLPEAEAMFDMFGGRVPILEDPIVSLGDGRKVRLLKLHASAGKLLITCRTEGG